MRGAYPRSVGDINTSITLRTYKSQFPASGLAVSAMKSLWVPENKGSTGFVVQSLLLLDPLVHILV
jgi:hypothetical protein